MQAYVASQAIITNIPCNIDNKRDNIVGLHSPCQSRYINNITSSKHSWPDYGAKIKDNPTCDTVPITPNGAPLLIIRKRNIVSLRVLVELPLELKRVTWSGIIWTCIWCNGNL